MTYEIPQALKYEEKIVFGMNIRQISYFFISFLASVAIFKLQASTYIRIAASVLIFSASSALAFFGIDKKIVDIVRFYTSKNQLGYFDKDISKFIGIKEASNDLALLTNNKLIGVLKVFPVNFAVKSEEEKKRIIVGYQRLLNSLDFSLQIAVQSSLLDFSSYFEKKQASNNKKAAELYKDYTCFLEEYIAKNKIKNRSFHIIISGKQLKVDKESNKKAVEDLENKLNLCKNGLLNCGIASKRLGTVELIEFFSAYFGYAQKIRHEQIFSLSTGAGKK